MTRLTERSFRCLKKMTCVCFATLLKSEGLGSSLPAATRAWSAQARKLRSRCAAKFDNERFGISATRRLKPRSRERHVHSHWIFAADAGARDGRTTTGSAAAGFG